MKAKLLLGSQTFDPDTLTTVYRAFDMAWERIAPGVGTRPEAIESARMKLANVMLGVIRQVEEFDAAGLADATVQLMHADPPELSSKEDSE
jgi:hypothetical protein